MRIFIVTYLLFVIGCKSNKSSLEKNSKEIIFNWYNGDDSLIKPDLFKLKIYSKIDFDSILTISNDTVYFYFKQSFDTFGIYRFCNEKKILTHSMNDTLMSEYCKKYQPFINKNVSYRGSKNYFVNGKMFTIYHFIENSGNHIVYDSYFLNGKIPICYYSFDRNDYIFCDTLLGYEFDNGTLKLLKKELLSDTTFFAKYLLQKSYPNYHRTATSYYKF